MDVERCLDTEFFDDATNKCKKRRSRKTKEKKVRICKEDEILNEVTNRCKKLKRTRKPREKTNPTCKDGFFLSKLTNRCKKSCKSGKVLDETTQKCKNICDRGFYMDSITNVCTAKRKRTIPKKMRSKSEHGSESSRSNQESDSYLDDSFVTHDDDDENDDLIPYYAGTDKIVPPEVFNDKKFDEKVDYRNDRGEIIMPDIEKDINEMMDQYKGVLKEGDLDGNDPYKFKQHPKQNETIFTRNKNGNGGDLRLIHGDVVENLTCFPSKLPSPVKLPTPKPVNILIPKKKINPVV